MKITFFNTSSDPRCLRKSLSSLGNVEASLKDDCSLIQPTIIVDRTSLRSYAICNYMYIPSFQRYYFTEITAMRGDMLTINGKVDVLMSYANQIRALNATVVRQEHLYNDYIIDNQLPIRQTRSIQYALIGTYNAGTGLYLTVDGGSES